MLAPSLVGYTISSEQIAGQPAYVQQGGKRKTHKIKRGGKKSKSKRSGKKSKKHIDPEEKYVQKVRMIDNEKRKYISEVAKIMNKRGVNNQMKVFKDKTDIEKLKDLYCNYIDKVHKISIK
tara:strand:+ start:244 stop:606 length:363 start_codon:yes stop_codon:yes gene_type:complete